MASISSLSFRLVNHDHNRKTATVKVSYRAILSLVERNMTGLRFRETIQLWGADPGPDSWLYNFPTSSFWRETDGVVNRERTVTLSDDILDEDGLLGISLTDEVYAKVSLRPLMPSSTTRNSNEISHKF